MTGATIEELVGRDDELTRVRALVEDLRRGQGRTLLIEGEAGVGKTRMAEALIDAARRAEATIFRAGAHAFDQTRPFAAVADALDLRRRSPDPRRANLGRLLVGGADPTGRLSRPRDLRHLVVEEIVDLVELACEPAPVLLVLEDLHWADTSTLLAFRSMAHRLTDLRVLLVGTLRPAPRPVELTRLVEEAMEVGGAVVRLQPLRPQDVQALVRSETGAEPGKNLERLLGKAGGNPLWIVEILRALSAAGLLQRTGTGVEVTAPELPDSFRELVLRRLGYLSPGTLDLLRITSVLGDAVSVSDLARVTGRRVLDLLGDLGEAFSSRLLEERGDAVAFRHQLVQEAIYRDVPGPLRQAMHREFAAVLQKSGAQLVTVAGHLMLGATPGDLEAVSWLRDAAGDAAARAPSVSVQLLRRSLALCPVGHPDVDLVTAELAEALQQAGDVAEAARVAAAALARPLRAGLDVRMRLSLISALSLQNRAEELVDVAQSWLAGSPDLSAPERSLVLAQASYGHTFSGDVVGGEAAARQALEIAERCGDVGMTVWALAASCVAVRTQGRYADALAQAQRAVALAFDHPGPDGRLRHPHFFLAMALSDSDRNKAAAEAFRTVLREYDDLGSAWLLPDTLLLAAERRFLLGEWDDALTEITAGLRVAAEHGHRISVSMSHAYQAVIAIARGEVEEAAALLARTGFDQNAGAYRYGVEVVAAAASLLAEARGQQAVAFELLLPWWRHDVEQEIGYYQRWLAPSLVRLGIAVGQPGVAGEVADWAEHVARLAPEVPTVQSAALRCRGLVEQDPDLLTRAVGCARTGGRFIDHAGACEDASAVLAMAGRPGEALALLSEAHEWYEAVGAHAWSSRTAAGLRRLGVRPGTRGRRGPPAVGWQSLTASERSVARLVAKGLTNREIAHRLYISPHTVNTHLRHAFQKLAVSTRTGLAAHVPPAPD